MLIPIALLKTLKNFHNFISLNNQNHFISMKKIKLGIAIAALIFIQSCNKDPKITSTDNADSVVMEVDSVTAKQNLEDNAILLESFPLPPEINGCSCYFARNEEEFEREEYIYADDYGSSAHLKLDGKMVKIAMEEGDFDPSNFQKTIENEQYKIHMTGKQVSAQEELMIFKGQLTIENKTNRKQTTTPIYGECGC